MRGATRRFLWMLGVTIIVVVVAATAMVVLYQRSRDQLLRAGEADLRSIAESTANDVNRLFYPARSIVEQLKDARLAEMDFDQASRVFFAIAAQPIRANEQINGAYVGLPNGTFLYVFDNIPPALIASGDLGPSYKGVAARIIDRGRAEPSDAWYVPDPRSGDWVRASAVPSPFDPRSRPWYQAAVTKNGVSWTAPYVYSSTGALGITLSAPIKSRSGELWGVVGVDMTLSSLSQMLQNYQLERIGSDSVLFVGDGGGKVIGHPRLFRKDGTPAAPIAELTDLANIELPAADGGAAANALPSANKLRANPHDGDGLALERGITATGEVTTAHNGDHRILGLRLPLDPVLGLAQFVYVGEPFDKIVGAALAQLRRNLAVAGAGLAIILLMVAYALMLQLQRERSRIFRFVLDNAAEALTWIDRSGRFAFVNDTMARLSGYSRGELERMSMEDLFPALAEAGGWTRRWDETKAAGHLIGFERPLRTKSGASVPCEISSWFSQYDGREFVFGFVRDITERRRMENELHEAMFAVDAAARAKADFLASMSHEIRTPMNGVIGMADLLAQTRLDDDQMHMLRTIRDSGNALITVINDILDFSKIEAGKLGIEELSMSVADTLEGVALTLTPNASKKGLQIHTFIDPSVPDAVQGDSIRIRQILFNLIGNAIKFSEKEDVCARAAAIAADDGTVWIRFEVADRGIGISLENQAKLFQAFSQAESSTTRRFGGTGLGLAICKRLTDLMGGRIGVLSAEAAGSTFWVEIPFRPTQDKRSNEKTRDLSGLKVALAGSRGERRRALVAYLQQWGGDVLLAEDAGDVLAMQRHATELAHPIDVVVLDYELDGARQQRVADEIRAALGGARLPLVALENHHGRGPRIAGADLVTVDANPLVRYRFISAVAVAAGRASPQVRREEVVEAEGAVPVTVDEAAARGQLILMAEDNPTNQDVLHRQLNALGFACEVVGDGRQALDRWRTGRYGLLLTDCHMPEMDGYELTGAIRAEERGATQRAPIIAITANALQGEGERCIAAGMDDFVTKPITMGALKAIIQKWMPGAREPALAGAALDDAAPDRTARAAGPIDPRALKNMFGEDPDTFREILADFLGATRAIVADLESGANMGNAAGVADAAHKLKSAARSVGAHALADICVDLEAAGKARDATAIAALTARLGPQMHDLTEYISSL